MSSVILVAFQVVRVKTSEVSRMIFKDRTIEVLANGYGLTLEQVLISDHGNAFKVYKGAALTFTGTEEAIKEFLLKYEKDRPEPYAGSMYEYKE